MRHVVPPQVQLVPDALVGQQAGHPARVDGSAPVVSSHMPLPADQQQATPGAQPVEVVAVQVGHVVQRVVEVQGVAALAPAAPGGRVVVAGQADRQREQVGALEGRS